VITGYETGARGGGRECTTGEVQFAPKTGRDDQKHSEGCCKWWEMRKDGNALLRSLVEPSVDSVD
jgi:hypothetical protein